MSNPIYLPAGDAEAWRRFLARPDLHWEPGHSAYELAHAWSGDGWPHEVVSALHSAGPALAGMEMLVALPEHQVPLPGGHRPSQTDLMVFARNLGGGLVVIAVEGTAREGVGPRVGEWRAGASEENAERPLALRRALGLDHDRALDELPSRLLHGAASALLEATRFGAQHAVLLVHSFSGEDEGYPDFAAFAAALGCDPVPASGEVTRASPRIGPVLWLGWARWPGTV